MLRASHLFLHRSEPLDHTYYYRVCIGVRLKIVDMRLLVVAHISYAPCGVGKTQVECKHLAEGWSGAEGCGHTVVVVVATVEYLVVGLTVVGREHHAKQWS